MAFFLLLVPIQAQAQGTDFAETHHYTLQYRQQIDDYLAGRLDMSVRYNSERIKYICGYVQSDFAATEMGKLKYNDLFGEVQNEEQAQDIQHLNDALAKETDCKKRFRIWVAYDDKWYYQKRKMQDAKNKEQEKIWASQVVDTGADVWDGVINGTFFAIPRKYMWAGRNRPDGFGQAVNLKMYLPEVVNTDSGGSQEPVDVRVVLHEAFVKRERPCQSPGQKVCTQYGYQARWFSRYLDCQSRGSIDEMYYGIWRKVCGYKEGQHNNLTPEFDEEVGMWRIGEAGYYEGEPEFPTYWFACKKPVLSEQSSSDSKLCLSAVYVQDNISAYYHFPRKEGFWHHREIHDQLQKKLQSFIVKTDNPYLLTGK